MSDVTAKSGNTDSDELKQALLAAFGDDAFAMLEADQEADDHDDFFLGNEQNFAVFPQLVSAAGDSPKVCWAKELYRGIYAAKSTTPIQQPSTTIDHPENSESPLSLIRCLLFSVGQQTFAISLSGIQEIIRQPSITELPGTAPWLRGVTSLRGEILSVTNLGTRLGLADSGSDPANRMIVIRSQDQTMATGLMVEKVLGIRMATIIDRGEAGKEPETQDWFAEFAGPWVEFEGATAVMIDAEKLLRCGEMAMYT